jgi:hypothetical protein
LAASTQLDSLRTLLRERGLGSALPAISKKDYPPAPTGFDELDALLGGGFPRGQITEVVGAVSSGCTSLVFSVLAGATRRGEVAAYIDATDCLDPPSAESAGVVLERLLWVRCGDSGRAPSGPRYERLVSKQARVDKAWQALNLVASAGGFGVIVLDLGGLSRRKLRAWQSRQWLRVRRAIENSPTTVVILATEHLAGSVAGMVLRLSREKTRWAGKEGVSLVLDGAISEVRC